MISSRKLILIWSVIVSYDSQWTGVVTDSVRATKYNNSIYIRIKTKFSKMGETVKELWYITLFKGKWYYVKQNYIRVKFDPVEKMSQ